jgi:predicted PurR-regulated permease PerM
VIGGIITSTLLTLVVVPVLYTYLDSWGRRISARFTRNAPAQAAGGATKPVASSPADAD